MDVTGAVEFGEGPESRALRATARGLITVAAVFAFILVAIPYVTAMGIASAQLVFGLGALVLLVLGLVYSRHLLGQWLLVASMGTSLCWQMVFPAGETEYSSIDVIVVFAGISAVMLSSRWLGLALAIVASVSNWVIWTYGPSDMRSVAERIGEGPEAVLQIACALLLAWWAWNVLRKESLTHDAQFELVIQQTRRAADERERARARRDVSTVIHESLLNTIRYVLSTPALNTKLLAVEVERTEGLVPHRGELPGLSVASLGQVIVDDSPSRSLASVTLPTEDVVLQRDVFTALRAAVSEAIRNAALHGGATVVDVRISLSSHEELQIEISDDGTGIDANAVEGFGVRHAIIAGVEAIGGTVHVLPSATSVRILLAAPMNRVDDSVIPQLDAFAKARFIVTSALAGLALGGLFFVGNLIVTFDPPEWLTLIVAGVGFFIATFVVLRRWTLTPVVGLIASLIVVALPWTLVFDELSCDESAAIIGLVGASGAAITTVALWTRRGAAAPGVVLWAVGVVLLLSHVPDQCQAFTAEASGYVVAAAPILLLAGFFIMRMYVRAQIAGARAVEERRVAQARANAAQLIDAEYGELVNEAQGVLRSIVAAGALSGEQRAQLVQVEAKIRAAIQVNPENAGGFAMFALDIVNRFANRGLVVRTKSFVDSYDQRPVGEDVRNVIRELAASMFTGELEVQLMSNGERDLLTMKFAHLEVDIADQELSVGDITVYVSHLGLVDEAVQVSIVVSRPVLVNV